ncbi:MAG TPA: CBS domain-containing protein [Bacteroidetes bacterium]|nr:CBS domain-containing protein [Bacteroidota bacterium]
MIYTKVGDLMIPIGKYPYISSWDTLLDAMIKITEVELEMKGKKSLPRFLLVYDKDLKLAGIVRRRDILRGLEPKFLTEKPLDDRENLFDAERDPGMKDVDNKRIMKGVMENSGRPVSDVMIEHPHDSSVDYDDHIFKAVYQMNKYKVSLLMVFKEEEMVGVIRTVDVFQHIADVLIKTEDAVW